MKTRLLTLLAIVLLALTISSCYSSRKSGCPGNPNAGGRFKG